VGVRKLWLIFAQACTVALAVLFVLQTLKPEWLARAGNHTVMLAAPFSASGNKSDAPHPGLALAAHRASPAVVSVTASKLAHGMPRDAWSRLIGPLREQHMQQGLGSGVIVSAEGYLLTNNHVVSGASDIEVQLADGRQAQATLVGSDPETDLALLKISLDRLPVIALGDADHLQVGDTVLAIGNPFNVGQTVTSGIVSALGRTQLGINLYENFIQTDAAINPGNSGGALVDGEGNLVGINTAIFSRSGGSLGIGFAIPVSTARDVMAALMKDGVVQRGWIGVQTRDLTPEFIESFKLPVLQGVLVSRVVDGAPAEKAGIKPGDVLLQVGEHAVVSPADLLLTVSALKPQSRTRVAVQRGKEKLEVTLLVGLRPKLQAEEDPE
jgi:Do/DeqQ family serine protease